MATINYEKIHTGTGLAAFSRETFVWLAEPERAGALDDLDAAARRAEP